MQNYFYQNQVGLRMKNLCNRTSNPAVVETGLYTDASATRQSLQNIMDTVFMSLTQVAATVDLVVANRTGNNPIAYTARNSITFNPGFSSGTSDHFTAYIDPNAMVGDASEGLTNNPLPPVDPSLVTPLTYTYYDNYSWTGHQAFQSTYLSKVTAAGNPFAETPATYSNNTRGRVTGSRVKVLSSNPVKWLTTTSYYDEKGRALQIISSNNTGGTDVITNKYDFSGTLLSSYVVNHNSQSTLTPETRVLTENKYDSSGRLLTITKTINDQAASKRVIATNAYDELSHLKTQVLGNNLETLTYEHNIRGWLTGINKSFTQAGNTGNYFGMELGYDKAATKSGTTTFTPRYDGNISGEIWKSKGDNTPRKYDFTYDKVNRLKTATFVQNTSGSTWNNTAVNFSVNNLIYDANGNIMSMRQYGLKGSSSPPIDELAYTYEANTNKLLKVTDTASDPNTTLGDFHDGTNTGNDYAYDNNGNLTSDANKSIDSITYNELNLPETITITDKGSIKFVYDAAGNKLQKIVTDNTSAPSRTIVTNYVDGFVYQHIGSTAQDTLQFSPTEDGRIRYVPAHGSIAATYVYDYFIGDHLGNVRMVLTEQTDFSQYTATMEQQNAEKEDASFYNLNSTREAKPEDYPQDNTTDPNAAVARLNGNDANRRVGPSIILKVMAGDTIQAAVRAFYRQQATKKNNAGLPAEQMLAGLLQALTAPAAPMTAMHDGSPALNSRLTGPGLTADDLQHLKDENPISTPENKPKAYLNYVFFDNQLNFVSEGSGVKQVSVDPGELETLNSGKMVAEKDGYVYIYTSNESEQDVFFDNLGVLDITGPILEETHYYPDGLAMAGISTVAPLKIANKFRYQGKELQDKEFADNTGLEWYDFEARYYDPQIGRWWSQDPAGQFSSPYLAMGNNWIIVTDPNGQIALIDDLINGVVGGLINLGTQLLTGQVHSVGQAFGYFGVGFVSGVAFEYGGPILSGGIASFGNTLVGGGTVEQALQQGVIGALSAGIAGPLGDKLGGAIGSLTGSLGSKASQIVSQIGTSSLLGMGFGAAGAVFSGSNIGEGALNGLKSGLASGTMSFLAPMVADAVRPKPKPQPYSIAELKGKITELSIDKPSDPSSDTRFISGVEVKKYGKVIDNGTIDLKPQLDRINAGDVGTHIYRNDGIIFQNNEGLLPPAGTYREYYVPHSSVGTSSIRIIINVNTGHAWLTADHYQSFIKIK